MADPQAEDWLYDSGAIRKFFGKNIGAEAARDEATTCRFHHRIDETEQASRFWRLLMNISRRTEVELATEKQ